jgi:hypothetical protein
MTDSLPEDTPYGEMIAHYALGMCDDWAGHPEYIGPEHAGLRTFLSQCADGLRWQRDEIERLRRELAEREKAAYKRGWEDREGDFLAGVERTGLVAMGPDTLAVTLGDAYRAGAEAMREACAAEVDCGCAERKDVLAAMERGGTPRPEWLCPSGGNCHATMAQTLRELPLVAMPDPPHDSPAKPGH